MKKEDGSVDLMRWACGIPGKEGSLWEGGVYKLNMDFPDDYPAKPPRCYFDPVLFHPNIYPSGTVCLSILNPDKGWVPTITVRQILTGIQDLMNNPNLDDPAQRDPFVMCRDRPEEYAARARRIAQENAP